MTGHMQRGFSLISAIFLLVVLAVLGVAMTTFSTIQQQSATLDVMGSRAYQAANAGMEWAAYNIAVSPGVAVPSQTLNGLAGNLSGFTVTVSYTASAVVDTNVSWSYDITSTATYGVPAAEDYVERRISAKM